MNNILYVDHMNKATATTLIRFIYLMVMWPHVIIHLLYLHDVLQCCCEE